MIKTFQQPLLYIIDSEDTVLDFSSGNAKVVESTVLNPEVIEENALLDLGAQEFTQFLKAIQIIGAEEKLLNLGADVGKITVFAPVDSAFEKSNLSVESMTPEELISIIFQHVVLEGSFPTNTLNGRKV